MKQITALVQLHCTAAAEKLFCATIIAPNFRWIATANYADLIHWHAVRFNLCCHQLVSNFIPFL